jgi:hypothetical protein
MNKLTSERIREIWAQMGTYKKEQKKQEKLFFHKGSRKWVKIKDWDFVFKVTHYDKKELRLFNRKKD